MCSPGFAAPRTSGAHRVVDTAIRDAIVLTEDAKLLMQPDRRQGDFTQTDPWRVLRIMGEIIEGFDVLAKVEKGVAFFGSARTGPDDPMYQAAQETARLLAEAGYDIITGAGPGVMEAANKGAVEAGAETIGLNIVLPHEQLPNRYVTPDLSFQFHYFALRKMHFLLRARAVAVFPGYLGGAAGFRKELAAYDRKGLIRIMAAAVAGGLIGSLLLLVSSNEAFSARSSIL